MATTSVVNVDGARVAYRLHGRGPAVVLVNGTAALDAHWGPVIGELSKNRTVISLDYSGSGDTTDDGSALSLQKLAQFTFWPFYMRGTRLRARETGGLSM